MTLARQRGDQHSQPQAILTGALGGIWALGRPMLAGVESINGSMPAANGGGSGAVGGKPTALRS